MASQTASAVHALSNSMLFQIIEGLKGSGGAQTGGGRPFQRSIADNRVLSSLPVFTDKKQDFKGWADRLINIAVLTYPASRQAFDDYKKEVDRDASKGSLVNLKQGFKNNGITDDQIRVMDEELYFVLMDKTAGDAKLKLESIPPGHGIEAYNL